MLHHHMFRLEAPRPLEFEISADTANVNMLTLATAAGYAGGVTTCIVTVLPGVYVYNASGSTPAFRTGGFTAGSTLKLINLGSIVGRGGNAGNGGNSSTLAQPTAGGNGTDAISLDDVIVIDNTAGFIGGGGGGGGGGGYQATTGGHFGGGGGGGGRGKNGGAHGTGGGSTGTPGADGTDGTATTKGLGGAKGGGSAGNGGDGGAHGAAGGNGGGFSFDSPGASGGNPGNAITTNGFAITWQGGYNGTQVKGAVV